MSFSPRFERGDLDAVAVSSAGTLVNFSAAAPAAAAVAVAAAVVEIAAFVEIAAVVGIATVGGIAATFGVAAAFEIAAFEIASFAAAAAAAPITLCSSFRVSTRFRFLRDEVDVVVVLGARCPSEAVASYTTNLSSCVSPLPYSLWNTNSESLREDGARAAIFRGGTRNTAGCTGVVTVDCVLVCTNDVVPRILGRERPFVEPSSRFPSISSCTVVSYCSECTIMSLSVAGRTTYPSCKATLRYLLAIIDAFVFAFINAVLVASLLSV